MYVKALGLLLVLAAHLAGILYVYDAGGDSREAEIRLEYTKKENKELKAARKATAREVEKNSELSGQLAAAQGEIRKRDQLIGKLETKYETLAQRGNDCNLTIGSVLLHNSGLGYEYDPGQLDQEGGTVSTVTGAAFIQHCNGLAVEFELQRTQLNKLIEAVQR